MEIQIRTLDRGELPGFRPYLLPAAAQAIEREDPDLVALGAVSGRHSLGAIAARLGESGDAALTDLFVDEAARRQGVGLCLVQALQAALTERGVARLTADYALGEEDLAAMDALLVKAGATTPWLRALSFQADSRDYRDHPLLGVCFTPRYKTPPGIVPFYQLPREALEALETADDIPHILSWALLKDRAVPDLSVAAVREGRVRAYLLAEESVDGGFVLLAAFRREGSLASDFLRLLRELLSRCWYWRGGDFPFYFSAINEHTTELALSLMEERREEREEHICAIFLTPEEDGAQAGSG